jgi:membrane protein implicated in regulation of membrane protease activity
MEAYIWFIIALVFFILEIITPGFVLLWFGVGALAAALLKVLGCTSLAVQIGAFVIVSIVLVILSRTIFKRFFMRGSPGKGLKTNMDALIGKIGVVSEVIDNERSTGRVVVDGQDWLARSVDASIIPNETRVSIEGCEGARLLVKQV